MSETVHILGVGRTDFKRHFQREGKGLRHMIVEAGQAALKDAAVDPAEIRAGIVGNFAGGLFTRQLHLGSFLTEVDRKLRGIPTFHTEAACASGGVAVLTAAQLIMGGIYDMILVVGAEQQKTMSPSEGGKVLGAAGDFQAESAQFGDLMFPKLFGRVAQLYGERYPLTEEHLARVAVKNRAHARLNPLAQTRDTPLTFCQAATESDQNQKVAPPLKVSDCSQITDGAAAVILASGRLTKRMGDRARVRLLGYGHATDHLSLAGKDAPVFSIATQAAQRAYDMAGVKPSDLDGAEVHDCFSISELIAYEFLGFAGRGQGPTLAMSGATALPGIRDQLEIRPTPGNASPKVPIVNAGGGLIGDGHPVGATGVRQVTDVYKQLRETAGDYQIEGAKRMLTFNMGGSFTTSVVMIWGA